MEFCWVVRGPLMVCLFEGVQESLPEQGCTWRISTGRVMAVIFSRELRSSITGLGVWEAHRTISE